MSINVVEFEVPFAVFLGDVVDPNFAKTALGLVEWRADTCFGQLSLPGCGVDAGAPNLTIADAKQLGVRSLIIGSAAVGGGIPNHWVAPLRDAAKSGIDIVAGLHIRLASLPGLAQAAEAGSARLIDVRVPPSNIPVVGGILSLLGALIHRELGASQPRGRRAVCGLRYSPAAFQDIR